MTRLGWLEQCNTGIPWETQEDQTGCYIGTAGSGYFGHPGRPGQVGGSVSTGTKQEYEPHERAKHYQLHAGLTKEESAKAQEKKKKQTDEEQAGQEKIRARLKEIADINRRTDLTEEQKKQMIRDTGEKSGVAEKDLEIKKKELNERQAAFDKKSPDEKALKEKLKADAAAKRAEDSTAKSAEDQAKAEAKAQEKADKAMIREMMQQEADDERARKTEQRMREADLKEAEKTVRDKARAEKAAQRALQSADKAEKKAAAKVAKDAQKELRKAEQEQKKLSGQVSSTNKARQSQGERLRAAQEKLKADAAKAKEKADATATKEQAAKEKTDAVAAAKAPTKSTEISSQTASSVANTGRGFQDRAGTRPTPPTRSTPGRAQPRPVIKRPARGSLRNPQPVPQTGRPHPSPGSAIHR